MKIGNVNVKVSIVTLVVFIFFAILVVVSAVVSPEIRSQIFWLLPALIILLVVPMALNYMSRKEYADLVPVYEREAKPVRIRMINEGMMGKVVRIEGVVEKVRFKFLNRPQYVVADRTGEIPVKMFTCPDEDIEVNDVVVVLGSVIRRYIFGGDPVINCVSIRKSTDIPVKPEKKA